MSDLADALAGLPGSDLVVRGIEDLASGRTTAEAALVEIARTRLRALDLPVPPAPQAATDAALRLYALLGARHPDRDPYVLYGAWLEQLASFLSAAGQRREDPSSTRS